MKEIEFFQRKNTFSMVCRVEAKIQARPGVIWSLLTDASGFSRWNSTVAGIDGDIREGERIGVHVPGTHRIFKPRVSDVVENKHMVWSDGIAALFKGSRSFELRSCDDGTTEFIMQEHFRGFIFALVKRSLPDFRPIFETYANDLKQEAERIAKQRSESRPVMYI